MTMANKQNENESVSDGPLLLKLILPMNMLSFGEASLPIKLNSLNVLIGANGAGKSNLIEAIALLRAAPQDFQTVTRQGGGVQEWIWKGNPSRNAVVVATISYNDETDALWHLFSFSGASQSFRLTNEGIAATNLPDEDGEPVFYYEFNEGKPRITVANKKLNIKIERFNLNASILAQRSDPERYPEITYLADQYRRIRLYREWQFGRNTVFRAPQPADLQNDTLEEDFSNLGMFLNRLWGHYEVKQKMIRYLRDLLPEFQDLHFSIQGGTVQVFFHEAKYRIPAPRLSDGTLRYLCLLAILCDPTPPPLICLEEPELGLHPDILPKIVDLLRDASTRTQLIVTTHSDILIDALTETPEAVLVCEKHDGQTRMERLDRDALSEWLRKYRLGELWLRGEIGGKRW